MDQLTLWASWASIIALAITVGSLLATSRGRRVAAAIVRSFRGIPAGVALVRSGVYAFYPSRESLSRARGAELIGSISKAQTEVTVVGISMQRTVIHQGLAAQLEELLAERPGLTVRFFLLDPESPSLPYIATTSGRTAAELKDAILQSIGRLDEVRDRLGVAERERLIVRKVDCHMYNTLVAVDVPLEPKREAPAGSFFIVEHSLFGISIDERYSIEVRRPTSKMYRKLRKSLRAISKVAA